MTVELLSRALKCGRTLDWKSEKLGSGPRSAVDFCCVILDKSLIHLLDGEGATVALDDLYGPSANSSILFSVHRDRNVLVHF